MAADEVQCLHELVEANRKIIILLKLLQCNQIKMGLLIQKRVITNWQITREYFRVAVLFSRGVHQTTADMHRAYGGDAVTDRKQVQIQLKR